MTARTAALAAILLAHATASIADIDYRVILRPDQRMVVAVTIPVRRAMTSVQMPNWSPGHYSLVDNWKRLDGIRVTGDGKELTPVKPNDYTWTIPSGGVKTVTFSYTVPVAIKDEMGHFSGPTNYIYVVDRKSEHCTLTIDVPTGWKIATGLDMKGGKYSAATYDGFADESVTFGKFRQLEYIAAGRPHIMALYGDARNDVDAPTLTKACQFISAMENDFFGNKPPYSHYVWHFNVAKRPDGGGGLEHLASTEITLASGLGPGIIGVNAHEFFHLWNVKRIRSRVLGPFDYTKLPETGALWWLEGVTEYYAHQLMTRYGFWDDKKWYDTIVRNVRNVRGNPARFEVSPYESSFRVKDAANGRGNSNGYKISYYDLGVNVGLCLDLEILSRTNGKFSLDDVERALWEECMDGKPGFKEDGIRKQCIHFGGAALGDFYDKTVMRPGDLPVEDALAKVGLKLATFDKAFTDLGIVTIPSFQAGGLSVTKVSGPAEGKLMVDDVVAEVNGNAVPTGSAYAAAIKGINPGDTVNFKVKRGTEVVGIAITAGTIMRPTQEIQPDPNATSAQLRLRDIWLYRGKKGWQPR